MGSINKTTTAQDITPQLLNEYMQPQAAPESVLPSVFKIPLECLEEYAAKLSAAIINPNEPEPEPEALLTLNSTPILWRGCKSFVCGVAKSRKTTALTMLTAIMLGRDETANGFFAAPNCRVLYIDTEQAKYDTQKIVRRVAALTNTDPNALPLHVLSLNQLTPEEIKGVMELAINTYKPDAVILDNWTDCVESVLDDSQCVEFSRQLRTLAETYKIGILSVIHANESDQSDRPKFRGWGAEEARKSDLTLFLSDKGEYSKATFGRCRGKRPDGFCVSHDPNGLPYIYTETAPQAPATNADKYANIVAAIPANGLTYSDLYNLIADKNKIAPASAKRWVSNMETAGAIAKYCGRYYRPQDTPNEPEPLPF